MNHLKRVLLTTKSKKNYKPQNFKAMADPVVPIVKKYEAVLKLPTKNDELLIALQGIYDKMHADDRYIASAALLALFLEEITKFFTAQSKYKARPPEIQKADRDNCKKIAVQTANDLRDDVQDLANADNAHAQSLITGANMFVKVHTARQKQKSEVKDTNESGVVIVFGEGKGPHEWMQSTDGDNWLPLNATRTARKKVSGLTVGKTYYFKSRQILPKDEYGPWSVPVPLVAR
jgi:hypothetical protein